MKAALVVTGANGFIGQHVVRAALADGLRVIALVRNPRSLAHFNHAALSIHRWRIEKPLEHKSLIPQKSVLCHLAAHIPTDYQDYTTAARCMEVNAAGTASLLEAAVNAEVQQFIYLSAGNAYCNMGSVARENDCLYPSARAPFYLTSKLGGEIFTRYYAGIHSLAATILRVSSPYGTGMRPESIVAAFIRAAIEQRPLKVLDGGRVWLDLLYVGDVVNAILLAIKTRALGIFNIGSGEPVTSSDLARHVVRLTTSESRILVKNNAGLNDANARRSGFPFLDISHAKSELGYCPTPLEEGLKKFIHQIKSQ